MIAAFSGPREAASKEANAGDHDPGVGAGDGRLEVLCEATVASEPSQRALDHPSPSLGFEGPHTLRSSDDLNDPFAQVGKRVEQLLTAIDAISKDVAQLGEPFPQRSQQRHSAMIVLDVGCVHQQREQQPLCSRDDVALTALHPLSWVKPTWTATFRRLDALAVDHTRRGNAIAPQRLARSLDESPIDPVPGAIVPPRGEA